MYFATLYRRKIQRRYVSYRENVKTLFFIFQCLIFLPSFASTSLQSQSIFFIRKSTGYLKIHLYVTYRNPLTRNSADE